MIRKLFALTLFAVAVNAQAQQEVTVDYKYEGNANLDSIEPSLRIAEFTDSRGLDNPNLIIAEGLGEAGGFQAEAPLAEIVRDAFVQAFSQGGVSLVEADEEMRVTGEISSSEAEIVDRSGVESIQLTIRTGIQLQEGSRTLYETSLFGRGTVPVSEGIEAAVRAALNRMVSDLPRDDYFMMELR